VLRYFPTSILSAGFDKNMKKIKNKSRAYLCLGLIFVLLQLFVILRNGFNYQNLIWFCNFAPILFAISFFIKKPHLIKALINIALIPDILFLIDFFSSSLFNFGIFGRVQPYLQENFLFIVATVILHLVAFLALFATYKIKPKKETLLYSACLILFTYIITFLFSSQGSFYNYVYGTRPGYVSIRYIPYMVITLLWPVLVFIFLVLPSQGIQYLIYKLCLRHKKK